MIVANLEPNRFSEVALAELRKFAEVRLAPNRLSPEESSFAEFVAEADVIWTRLGYRVDAALLALAPRVRVIVSATTGLNHIDLSACADRGVEVISLQGESSFLSSITATAELALSLMLECVRRTGRAHSSVVENGQFDRESFVGQQLSGRTLGLVGLGRLGSIMAGYGHALRMRVLFCDPRTDLELDPPNYAVRTSFEELLRDSDVVSLHANHVPSMPKLFNRDAFLRMREGSVFINTARGEMVDEADLIFALQDGALAAAGIDVIENELGLTSLGLNHPLVAFARQTDRLVITPHIGGACSDAMASTELFVAKKLRAFLSLDT